MTGPRGDPTPRISWGNIASLAAIILTALAMLALTADRNYPPFWRVEVFMPVC